MKSKLIIFYATITIFALNSNNAFSMNKDKGHEKHNRQKKGLVEIVTAVKLIIGENEEKDNQVLSSPESPRSKKSTEHCKTEKKSSNANKQNKKKAKKCKRDELLDLNEDLEANEDLEINENEIDQ